MEMMLNSLRSSVSRNRELAEKLGVKSSPTLLFFNKGQEVASRLTGGIKRSDIIRNLDSMLPADKVNEIKSLIKPSVSEFDVIILGAGPGGLTAGLISLPVENKYGSDRYCSARRSCINNS